MLTVLKIIGFGICGAILSIAISAVVFRHCTEKDTTLVFVAIMDFIVISVIARVVLKIYRHQRG
jgi:hypothetical protein